MRDIALLSAEIHWDFVQIRWYSVENRQSVGNMLANLLETARNLLAISPDYGPVPVRLLRDSDETLLEISGIAQGLCRNRMGML